MPSCLAGCRRHSLVAGIWETCRLHSSPLPLYRHNFVAAGTTHRATPTSDFYCDDGLHSIAVCRPHADSFPSGFAPPHLTNAGLHLPWRLPLSANSAAITSPPSVRTSRAIPAHRAGLAMAARTFAVVLMSAWCCSQLIVDTRAPPPNVRRCARHHTDRRVIAKQLLLEPCSDTNCRD